MSWTLRILANLIFLVRIMIDQFMSPYTDKLQSLLVFECLSVITNVMKIV